MSLNFFDMSSDAPRGLGASPSDEGAFAQYLQVAESGAISPDDGEGGADA